MPKSDNLAVEMERGLGEVTTPPVKPDAGLWTCPVDHCGGTILYDGEELKCFLCSWRPAA